MATIFKRTPLQLPKGRFETLVDGIFAIAMTLLVLTIEVPKPEMPLSNAVFSAYLLTMYPKFISYGLAFVLLAILWRINLKYFLYIKHVDNTFYWINIFWLMFVALVPFSTSLSGKYGEYQVPVLFFHVNFFIIFFLSYIYLHYAAKRNLFEESVDAHTVSLFKKRILTSALIALLAICLVGLSFLIPSFLPHWSSWVYALIPVIHALISKE